MRSLLLLCIVCTPFFAFAESVFYKYKDAGGQTVINDSLPPEVVTRGYTIINSAGHVVQVIPAAKSGEELALEKLQKEISSKVDAQAQKEKDAQERMDNLLRQSFESMQDIVDSEKAQLNSVEVVMKMAKTQIERLHEKLKTLEAQQANYVAQHQAIPANLKDSLLEASKALKENSIFLKKKEQEMTDIRTYYKTMKDRFTTLQQEPKKEPSQ